MCVCLCVRGVIIFKLFRSTFLAHNFTSATLIEVVFQKKSSLEIDCTLQLAYRCKKKRGRYVLWDVVEIKNKCQGYEKNET